MTNQLFALKQKTPSLPSGMQLISEMVNAHGVLGFGLYLGGLKWVGKYGRLNLWREMIALDVGA
ncbi:MAG: hypothetical protein ABIL58_28000 [Pseudomonadota bacterium]